MVNYGKSSPDDKLKINMKKIGDSSNCNECNEMFAYKINETQSLLPFTT